MELQQLQLSVRDVYVNPVRQVYSKYKQMNHSSSLPEPVKAIKRKKTVKVIRVKTGRQQENKGNRITEKGCKEGIREISKKE